MAETKYTVFCNVLLTATLATLLQCVNGDYSQSVSDSFVDQFLIPQNQARSTVGLSPLQWDDRLAQYAQWWANQRAAFGNCQLQHSGGPYGENVFWGSGKSWGPVDAVNEWLDERQYYNYYSNSCYFSDCGHYTQIVWRGSKYVGCAKSTCADGDVFITCNYFPPGNYVGQRPY